MDYKIDIAHISTPWYTIPTLRYGGVEKALFDLICAQRNHGHKISLYSPGDCHYLQGISISSLFKDGIADSGFDRTVEVAQAIFAIKKILKQRHNIIHVHNLYPMLAIAELIDLPMVFTYHSVLKPDVKWLNKICKNDKVVHVFLSEAHRKEYGHINKNAKVVPYGINTKNIPFYDNSQKEEYFAFLGSLTEEKGIFEVLEVARHTGIELKIAGKIKLQNMNLFETKIKPIIESMNNVSFIGEITNSERDIFLGRARAMLFPVKWNEPFGRVMLESLAVGTPVLAFGNGSVPEIINEEVGAIVGSSREMIHAINNMKKYDAHKCRKHVERNFSIDEMEEKYAKIYEELINTNQ